MAIKESCSRLTFRKVGSAAISSNQAFTAFGAVIDTKDFDFDVCFVVGLSARTDGTFNVRLQMADDSGFTTNVEVVDRDHLVGQPTGGIVTLNAVSTAGTVDYKKLGVFANRRFVRMQVEGTGITSGATVDALVALGGEIVPA